MLLRFINSRSSLGFRHPLFSSIFYLSILQGLNYILPFISLPFLFSKLGAENYGLIAFAYSVSLFLNVLVDFGFDLSATREISIHRDEKSSIDLIFSATLVSKIILLFIAFLILIILVVSLEKFRSHSVVFFLMFMVVVGNCLSSLWYFQGIEKMKHVTIISGLAKILSFVPMFFVIRSSDDLYYASLLYGLGYFISGILSLYIIFSFFNVKFILPTFCKIRLTMKNSIHFFISRFTVSFYTTCNTIIVGLVSGNETTAFFNIAEKVYQAFASLINPLTQGLYPYMSKHRNITLFKKILVFSVISSLLIVILIFWQAPGILEILFSSTSTMAINTLRILILGGLALVPSYLLGYPFLGALGYSRFTNNTVVIVGVTHLLGLGVFFYSGNLTITTIAFMVIFSEYYALILRLFGVFKFRLMKVCE